MKIFAFLLLPFFAFSQSVDSLDFQRVGDELLAVCWVDQAAVLELNGAVVLPMSAMKSEFGGCMCMVKTDLEKTKMAVTCIFTGKSFSPITTQAQKDLISKNKNAYLFGILDNEPLVFWWER